MLAKKLGTALEKKAAGYGNRVMFLHVNCRIDRSLVAIFNKALRSLGHTYPSRGLSFEELLQALFEELRRDRVHMLVAFDEADALVESDPSSLYTITRIREISPDVQVFSSLLISKTLDYVKMVDLSTLSSLQRNAISLDPYSAEQLYDILLSRSQLAFREGCIDDESLQMAADIASMYGDARYAIDLIHRAGNKAEVAGSGKVMPEHVRLAKEAPAPGVQEGGARLPRQAPARHADGHLRPAQEERLRLRDHRGGGEELQRPVRVDGHSPEPPHPGLERHQRARRGRGSSRPRLSGKGFGGGPR